MNAESLLSRIAKALNKNKLEVVLIGNAAAALHGAPVTTIDFDFMFRKTPANMSKLKALAKELDAIVLRPYYPVSNLYRVVNDDNGLQLDFMANVHGVKSFASLRSRAEEVSFGNSKLLISSLEDIIKSKQAAKRERDLAVLPILKKVLKARKN
jgi:predicted nucleotidyltransferase